MGGGGGGRENNGQGLTAGLEGRARTGSRGGLNLVHSAVGLGGLEESVSDSGCAKGVVRPITCNADDTGKTLRIVHQCPAKGAPAPATVLLLTSRCMTAF